MAVVAAVANACAGPARAAQQLVLVFDRNEIVKLPEVPATIVISNPGVADVTIDGTSLFLYPRGYGMTSITALNSKGETLADYVVRVIYEDRDSISMYTPSGRKTYTCARDCEIALRVGDDSAHMGQYVSQVGTKTGFAQGASTGGDMPMPPSPASVESRTGIAPP